MTKREYLYTVLSEEAAEVSQAASKIMRFGEQAYDPADKNKETNAESLLKEVCHLLSAVTMLQDAELLPILNLETAHNIMNDKGKRVYQYLMMQD